MSQWTFAWADGPDTAGNIPPWISNVEDEEIVSFTLSQNEGDAAQLSIEVRNPKRGLLSGQVWAFFSVDSEQLFYGRLVGIPSNIFGELVTMTLIAKPLDLKAKKYDLAFADLMVLPRYDPVWIDPDRRPALNTASELVGDIDVVLEGWSAQWHIDRTTLAVTISDLIEGEDGTLEFAADEVPYDSVTCEPGQAPLTSVKVIGHVNWSQSANGIIDFGERTFDTWTGGSIASSWPQKGSGLSGGWSVYDAFAIDVLNVNGKQAVSKNFDFENKEKTHNVGDVMSVHQSWTEFPVGGSTFISNLHRQAGVIPSAAVISYASDGTAFDPYAAIDTGDGGQKENIPLHMSYNSTLVAGWLVNTKLQLQYDAGDKRFETARFNMIPDLQPFVTAPDPEEVVEQIELNGTDVGLQIDGTPPLGDTSRNQYFTTDRGKQSFEYLLHIARSHILFRARAVSVTFDAPIERAAEISLRKNAQIADPRFPGEVAWGKITAYSITGDGDSGELKCSITMLCPIGREGDLVVSTPSTDFFVDPGFVDDEFFVETGGSIALPSGDLGYTIPDVVPTGLIYPLTKEQVTVAERVDTFITEPIQVGSDTDQQGNTIKTFATFPGQAYYLELLPVEGTEFDTQIPFEVTQLRVLKGIDLEVGTT